MAVFRSLKPIPLTRKAINRHLFQLRRVPFIDNSWRQRRIIRKRRRGMEGRPKSFPCRNRPFIKPTILSWTRMATRVKLALRKLHQLPLFMRWSLIHRLCMRPPYRTLHLTGLCSVKILFNSHIVKYLSLLVIAKNDKSGENTVPVISSVWPSNFYIYLNSEFPI